MTDGAGSEPSRRGGEALVFCTAQYKYLLRSQGWGQTGCGGAGAEGWSPASRADPSPQSQEQEVGAQGLPVRPPLPRAVGLGAAPPAPVKAAEPPPPPPRPLRSPTPGTGQLWGGDDNEPAQRHPMDGAAPTSAPAPAPGR